MRFRTTLLNSSSAIVLLISVFLCACGSETDSPNTDTTRSAETTSTVSAEGAVKILTERYRAVAPNDGLESDSVFFLIPEKNGYELTSPVPIDAREPDTLGGSVKLLDDSLAAGTTVDSYLLHFDKIGSSSSDVQLSGEVRLPGRLLGLITTQKHLDDSDEQLGVPGIRYPEPGTLRPAEIDQTADRVIIGPERRTLDLALTTNVSADQMRILIRSE